MSGKNEGNTRITVTTAHQNGDMVGSGDEWESDGLDYSVPGSNEHSIEGSTSKPNKIKQKNKKRGQIPIVVTTSDVKSAPPAASRGSFRKFFKNKINRSRNKEKAKPRDSEEELGSNNELDVSVSHSKSRGASPCEMSLRGERPWRLEKADNVQKPKGMHKKGNEKKEDSSRVAPPPPAPPRDLAPTPGYETCLFTKPTLVPAGSEARRASQTRKEQAHQVVYTGELTELEIKKIFATWLWRRSGCVYTDVASQFKVESVIERHRYRYKLESFVEKRSVQWINLPYHEDDLDGPEAENPVPIQAPWAIERGPTNGTLWEAEKILMAVPGTAMVRLCEVCIGKGWTDCWKCDQAGKYLCYWCDGKGGYYDGDGHWKYCWTCKGIGVVFCVICDGFTKLVCSSCEGYFEIKFFVQLTIEFKTKKERFYFTQIKTDVPEPKQKNWLGKGRGSGERVLTEDDTMLAPLNNFQHQEINSASAAMITLHENSQDSTKIHRQRHFVDVIPVFEVEAKWKENSFSFWVYGQKGKRKIFFPDAAEILPARKSCDIL